MIGTCRADDVDGSRVGAGVQRQGAGAQCVDGQDAVGAAEQVRGQGQVHIAAGDRDVLDVADVVQRTGVGAVASEHQYVTRIGATDHGVVAAERSAKDDGVVAVTQTDAVSTTDCRVHKVVAAAGCQRVIATAQGDAVGVGRADDDDAICFGRRIERQVASARCAGSVQRGVGQQRGIHQRDVDVAGAVHVDAAEGADIVEFSRDVGVGVGVGQHVSAATANDGVGAAQCRAEGDGVVASAEVDTVSTTDGRVHKVVAAAGCQRVIATAQGDAVGVGRADDDDAICFGRRIERQVASARCAGSVQRGVGQQRGIHQRDVDVAGAVHVDAAEGADIVEFSRDVGVSVGVGQHVGAAAANDGVVAAERRTEDDGVIAEPEVDAVRTAHRSVDKIIAATQAGNVIAAAQRDAVCCGGADDVQVGCGFGRRIERQACACRRVDRRRARCEQGVGERQVDVRSADNHAFDVGDVIKLMAVHTGDVGVNQHVGAIIAQHGVAAVEIAAKRDGVVAAAQVDAVVANGAGIDRVVASARAEDNVASAGNQDIVARAADQGVVAATADQGVADGVAGVAPAGDDFSRRVAGDAVRTRRTDQALDAGGTPGKADVGRL